MMGERCGLSEKASLVKASCGSQTRYIVDKDGQKDTDDNGGTDTHKGGSRDKGVEITRDKLEEEASKATQSLNEALDRQNVVIETDVERDVVSYQESSGIHTDPGTQEIDSESSGRFSLTKTPIKKQVMLLVCVCVVFISGCSCSMIAIFFPHKARAKGMSLAVIGFVFGVYELVLFMTFPFVGNYMARIGVKFVCLSGVFVNGVSTGLFGVLDKGPDGLWFGVMCVVCRIVEGVGFAVLFIACITIVSNEFPEQIGIMLALLESSFQCGFMVGPEIGAQLYQLAGYGFTFYIMGGCILASGLVLYLVLPDIHTQPKTEHKRSICQLLQCPIIVITMVSVCLGTTGSLMYRALFSTHMSKFNLSVSGLGWTFMPGPLTFISFALVWGYLSKFESLLQPFLIIGQVVFGIAFIINEPIRYLSFIPFEIWTVTLTFVLINVCVALIQTFGMRCMVNAAYKMEFGKDVETYAMVSGLYNTAYSFGGFCGPIAGGASVQVFGFPTTYSVFGLVNICFVLVKVGYLSIVFMRRKTMRDSNILSGCGDNQDNENRP